MSCRDDTLGSRRVYVLNLTNPEPIFMTCMSPQEIELDKSTNIRSADDLTQETYVSVSKPIEDGGGGITSWNIREVLDTHGDIEAHLLSLCATSGVWYIIPRENHTPGFIVDFTDPSFRNVVAQPWNYLDWATPSRINILLELLYSVCAF